MNNRNSRNSHLKKILLDYKPDFKQVYSREVMDTKLQNPTIISTDDNLITFTGSRNTDIEALLAANMTSGEFKESITTLDLPKKHNSDLTGNWTIHNRNVET